MTSTKTVTRDSVPTGYADELGPLVRLHTELGRFRLPAARVKRARANLADGRVAFDPNEVLRSAGDLDSSLGKMATAFEMCGMASPRELDSFRNGYAIAQRLDQISREVVQVQQGSLYPALHRLENRGLLTAEWKLSDTGRDAKFYRLTKRGRAQLEREAANWRRLTQAIALILRTTEGTL